MSETGSVTRLIADLKTGDQQAAQALWESYYERLARLASKKLGSRPRRIADEDDVAVDAFHSLCRGAAKGQFRKLSDRNDLWQLLVVLSSRKAADQLQREGRGKRGSGKVRGESVFLTPDDLSRVGIDQVIGSEPTPEFVSILAEEFDELLQRLDDDQLRRIALSKLDHHTNEEIRQKENLSLRAVERKLKLIRQIWEAESGR